VAVVDRVRIVSMVLVGVLVLVTLAACGKDNAKIVQEDVTREVVAGAPTEMPTPDAVALTAEAATAAAGQPTTAAASPVAGGGGDQGAVAQTVQLEAFDIGWRTADQPAQPNLIVSPGTVIELVNTGAAAHNFEVKDLGIDEDMPVGYSGQVTIPADAAPGQYEFICNVPGHAAAGMVGTLTVQ
jgi:uncharacterized cupredoxin-like copper-binding protein